MGEKELEKLKEYFQRVRDEYDTPEKATALLQREGIIDETGEPAIPFREASPACR